MFIKNELNQNIEEFNDYEEFPYCLEWDIMSTLRDIYLNSDKISKNDAMAICRDCEAMLNLRLEDSPLNEFWLECVRIEILAYRMFKIDMYNINISEHILQCKILDLFNGQYVEREVFEDMMLMLSEIIPNIADIMYYADYNPYVQESLRMVEYKNVIKKGNYKQAYNIYKAIIENLIINENKYLKDYNYGEEKEIRISTAEDHNNWLKSKFSIFVLNAIASNNLDDSQEYITQLFKNYNVESLTDTEIEEMKSRIKVEKFCNGAISNYSIDDINKVIKYFEEKNLLDDNRETEYTYDLIYLYIKVLLKITLETYDDTKFQYEVLHKKIIDLCKRIERHKNEQKVHIVGDEYKNIKYYSIELISNLLLCIYNKNGLDEIMNKVQSYVGDNNDLNKIFKVLSLSFVKTEIKEIEMKFIVEDITIKFIEIYRYIIFLEEYLKIKTPKNMEFAYYTTLQTFSYLLSDEKSSDDNGIIQKYRLSIMNSGYMNDPNEGSVLYDILKLQSEKNSNKTKICNILGMNFDKKVRIQYNNALVFLKSFSSKIDKLNMWSEYGDKGKGCCIVVDGETFSSCEDKLRLLYDINKIHCDMQDEYNLYNVVYWNCQNNTFLINGEENRIVKKVLEKILSNIIEICEKNDLLQNNYFSEELIVGLIKDLLSRLSYLIKYDEYQDENEARIVIKRSKYGNNCNEISEIENNDDILSSMLYIRYPLKTIIKEVILGPKVENPDFYAPFILRKLSDINFSCGYTTIVTRSSIDYR